MSKLGPVGDLSNVCGWLVSVGVAQKNKLASLADGQWAGPYLLLMQLTGACFGSLKMDVAKSLTILMGTGNALFNAGFVPDVGKTSRGRKFVA